MRLGRRFAAGLLALALGAGLAAAAPAPGFSTPPPGWSVKNGNPGRELRAHLAAQRRLNLARLHAYLLLGVFPHNTVSNGLINMFKDPQTGVLCAVANLISRSGRQDLVDQQVKDNNFVRLGEVTSGPMYEWMLDSGFTQEEIALIQLPDSPITRGGYPGERPTLPGKIYPTVEQADAMVREHLKMVEGRLRADTARSLDLAVARAAAYAAAKELPPPPPPPPPLPRPRPFPHPVG